MRRTFALFTLIAVPAVLAAACGGDDVILATSAPSTTTTLDATGGITGYRPLPTLPTLPGRTTVAMSLTEIGD